MFVLQQCLYICCRAVVRPVLNNNPAIKVSHFGQFRIQHSQPAYLVSFIDASELVNEVVVIKYCPKPIFKSETIEPFINLQFQRSTLSTKARVKVPNKRKVFLLQSVIVQSIGYHLLEILLRFELSFLGNRETVPARRRYYSEILPFKDYDKLPFDLPFLEISEENGISRSKYIEPMR